MNQPAQRSGGNERQEVLRGRFTLTVLQAILNAPESLNRQSSGASREAAVG